ncbi:MAG: hypothetical protein CM1200mP20_15510 [Pseudomonadota bacterium]|nr:MAG: hypothetical protein CM1200mP20_15510 [Pseudomonadota bacterium]
MTRARFGGVFVPVITPFTADLLPDTDAFVSHCRWMLDQGVDGLAIFGTTSEANSLTVTGTQGAAGSVAGKRGAGQQTDARYWCVFDHRCR